MSFYRFLATSDHWFARFARRVRKTVTHFSLPAPAFLTKPMLWIYLAVRSTYYFCLRVFICEPLFKAYCTSCGKGVRTGVYVHWIQGRGDLIVGDYVHMDGKSSIAFAVRFSDRPSLVIGDHTGVSHDCSFTVGKRITIGRHCRIASGVQMFDSSGHPTEVLARAAGMPPVAADVKPIVIADHVWIGRRAVVFPGVSIGEASIISTGAVVMSDVPPYTIVAGNPARKIGSVPRFIENTSLNSSGQVQECTV